MGELTERGQAIYDALLRNRKVGVEHRTMALNAARMSDTLDAINAELEHWPGLTVVNSQGTTTINPLVSEARMLTSALSQILTKMGVAELPDVEAQETSKVDELAKRRAERQAARTSNAKNMVQPGG